MILKLALTVTVVLLISNLISVTSFSLSNENYDRLVKTRCFNQSTVLGQVRPNGITVENLISMIERAEIQNPDLKPHEIVRLFLERFHYDRLIHDTQSITGYRHSRLTTLILGGNPDEARDIDGLENIFTEDEKCNLFFTLSHSINDTAMEDEQEEHKYEAPMFARAPETQHLGTEVPIPKLVEKDPKKLPPIQSNYLEESPNVPLKRQKREVGFSPTDRKKRILTRRPREIGIASFLGASKKPISMGRVLLGLYAGLTEIQPQPISQILDKLGRKLKDKAEDKEVNPLMAVTLSDIYGIDNDKGLSTEKLNFWGSEGEWNNSDCQTKYVLNEEYGILMTGADFRGGIDGYNIGESVKPFRNQITASQALRFYYSKNGLPESGICNRNDKAHSEIQSDLKSEAISYLHMWNSYSYDNQRSVAKIINYANDIENYFRTELEQARSPTDEESNLCTSKSSGKIDSAEIETHADIYIMLDMKKMCDDSQIQYQSTRDADLCARTSALISNIVRRFRFSRYHGSVSVFFNGKSLENSDLTNDGGARIQTKLHSRLFNSTSNQCASCRSMDPRENSFDTIEKRSDLFDLIEKQIRDIKNSPKSDNQGLPAKVFYWFDYGTVEPLPSDKNTILEIEKILRELKVTHRDVQYFGVGTNETALKDLVSQPENLININSNDMEQFVLGAVRAPQIFEYPSCSNSTSNNVTYTGLITPGYRQFWMMSPTQFIRSKDVKLSFKARSYPIEVCFGREQQPDKKKENCKYSTNPGETVEFKLSNPCANVIFEKCPSFFFTVNVNENAKMTEVQKYCTDKDCTNLLQTEWTFSHTGIRCNGSTHLTISIFFIAFAFILQRFL